MLIKTERQKSSCKISLLKEKKQSCLKLAINSIRNDTSSAALCLGIYTKLVEQSGYKKVKSKSKIWIKKSKQRDLDWENRIKFDLDLISKKGK